MKIVFDADEQMALMYLDDAVKIITEEWGLRANVGELVPAIHVIQQFVIMHMLQRLDMDGISHWFNEE